MRTHLHHRRGKIRIEASAQAATPACSTGQFVFDDDAWEAIAQSLKLSDREFQIVQCVFDDRKELAIATDLDISPHTVHTYLERLYRKLGVSSRVELVVRVFEEHLSLSPAQLTTQQPSCGKTSGCHNSLNN